MRNKTVKILSGVCALLFTVALGFVLIQDFSVSGEEIEILSDGKVIYTGKGVSAEPVYIDAVSAHGVNRIRIDANGVLVESADCKNLECVHMGYLKSAYMPIVCLPNNLVIRYTGSGEASAPDAISR